MDPAAAEERIRSFLAKLYPARAEQIAKMPTDLELWTVVDSMGLLELVDYVEELFGIAVDPFEFVPENFSTLDSLVGFVVQKGNEAEAKGSKGKQKGAQKQAGTKGKQKPGKGR